MSSMEDNDHSIRAIVIVAYVHASVGDALVAEARDLMVDSLVVSGPDWVDDGVQMVVAEIFPLDSDESIEYFVEDMDDLDSEGMEDMDDLRDETRSGSTPR
jgi:hypothetical protein